MTKFKSIQELLNVLCSCVASTGVLYYYDTNITLEKDSVNGIPTGWKVVSLG